VRYRNVFVVTSDLDGVSVDAFSVVDMEKLAAARAKGKLTDTVDPYEAEVSNTYRGIEMRSRFADGGPYNLHTESPLTRDELDTLLQDKQRNGTLREFLNKARM
jgi:hypothetical protein